MAPRNYGILMHKVFENIEHEGQIAEQLDLLRANGILSDEEQQHLRDTIADAFADPLVRSWFAPKWETVRNEADIIVPRESAVRRPDRVATKGTEAVVVDYKFGAVQRRKPCCANPRIHGPVAPHGLPYGAGEVCSGTNQVTFNLSNT
ncbi:MAG: hypothetical protein ACLTZY_03430 [Alistipes indistinctus]